MIRIYIDGAFDPKDGASGIGIVWVDNGIQEQLAYAAGVSQDNHELEFKALLKALDLIQAKYGAEAFIQIYTDSKVVVQSVAKKYNKQAHYATILSEILSKLEELPNVYLDWLPEKQNKGADNLARQGIDKNNKTALGK